MRRAMTPSRPQNWSILAQNWPGPEPAAQMVKMAQKPKIDQKFFRPKNRRPAQTKIAIFGEKSRIFREKFRTREIF